MSDATDVPALFDARHLATYTLGDAAIEQEVLPLFLDHAMAVLSRLREAGSEKEWREAAHSLKGSARGVGAFVVGASAAALENYAAFASNDRAALLAGLELELAATSAAMLRHLETKR